MNPRIRSESGPLFRNPPVFPQSSASCFNFSNESNSLLIYRSWYNGVSSTQRYRGFSHLDKFSFYNYGYKLSNVLSSGLNSHSKSIHDNLCKHNKHFLRFIGPCIVIYSYSKTNQMHQFLKFILFRNNTLHTRISVFPSIIRSSRLYIQQQVYVKQILLPACQAGNSICLIYTCCR